MSSIQSAAIAWNILTAEGIPAVCWALMLLMLPFGAASLGWMLALGIVMAVEKNVSWGRRLGRPLGALLLLLGLAVALRLDAGLW